MKELNIVVATISKDKIDGISSSFKLFFPEEEYKLNVYACKAESDVDDQPFGNDTYTGAYNRINNVMKKYEDKINKKNIKIDYYVSCEAGIDDTNKTVVNGVLTTLYASEQVVCIYSTQKDEYSFGKSSSWIIPSEDIEEIRKTDLNQFLRKRECTGLHDIGNGKYVTRSEAVEEGSRAAIAGLIFREKCKEHKEKEGNNNLR